MGNRPGVMLYFSWLTPLSEMEDDKVGQLFKAILRYCTTGEDPSFSGELAIAWGFLRPTLDRDADSYMDKISKKQYATFCRELKKAGGQELDFEEWRSMTEDERYQLLSSDTTRHPISISKTKSISKSIPVSKPITDSTPCSGRNMAQTGCDSDFNTRRSAAIDALKDYE